MALSIDQVLTEALFQLTEKHRCDYEDIVYQLAKKNGCLAKVPFKNTIMELGCDR